ncbi:hypothetical protein B7P43_G10087 [Cryptotermes secundus]|uniref:Uncharacterized protein n=1 Tax=Cryptotermes secundus TaxID=105785 RepID=A0A2J7QUY1_9NEOP|nr:hypothetical protein B7P43_G10087 [Cryptotermes secundus]
MLYIIVRGCWCDIIVLMVHAPAEDKTDDKKDNFNKLEPGNESLHETSNDNGVRVVNFATSKNLTVKSTMFPHKLHNQGDHILVDRRRHSSILDV